MLDDPTPWANDPIITPNSSFTGVIPGVKKPKEPNIPSGYEPDPDNPGRLRPMPGGPNDSSPPPGINSSDLSGNDYLSTLDKPTASMVKALADGRKSFPSGAALKSPYWQNMLAHVGNYDPGFDETNYTARAATRKDFDIGAAGKNIRALNTAIGHLGQLYGQIGGTASHGFVPLNVAENAFNANVLGDSGPTTYGSTTSALAGELTAVYRGAGGAEADIKRYIDELSPNASEAQKKATIRNISGLLNSRLEALQDQYKKGMGEGSDGYQFLDPKAQQVLSQINGSGSDGGNHDGGGATPPPIASGPGGGSGGGGSPSPVDAEMRRMFHSGATTDQIVAYGRSHGVDPNPDQINQARQKGTDIAFVQPSDEDKKVRDQIATEDKLGLDQQDPATRTLIHGATLGLSDEASGVGNALANVVTSPFTGNFDPVGSYKLGRDVERKRLETAHDQLGYGAAPVEFVGGMASGNPTSALSAVGTGIKDLVTQGAKAGATGGALAGFGNGEGAEQSLVGAGTGAVGGAAVGALAPYAAGKFAARSTPKGMAPALADAAQAENVNLIRPMVDPAARGKFGALESDPTAQPIIRSGARKVSDQIEGRVANLGQGGTALEPGAAGEKLQLSGNRYIQRSRGIKTRLYTAAENAGGDARFVPQNAIDQINTDIQTLSANPKSNAATIDFLKDKLSDLSTPGGKTVAEIRNIRDGLRGEISERNLTMTNAERLANNALHAATDDISQAVPEAGRLYKRADAFYSERQTVVDDIKRSILGPKNNPLDPQTAFQNIKILSSPGGNLRRLSAVTRYLEPEERQDVAATVASTLGRTSQDGAFSASRFITQTDKLSPAALRTIFGAEGAESIGNLRTLSQALKDAGGDINFSRSTTVANRMSAMKAAAKTVVMSLTGLGGYEAGGVGGALTGAAVAAGAMGGNAGLKVLSARAMVNPRVARWLAETAKVSTPTQAQQAVKGLSLVISREPALAQELTPIRDFLNQRVTQALAAEPNEQDQQQR